MAAYDPKRPKPTVNGDEPAQVEALIDLADQADKAGSAAPQTGEAVSRADEAAPQADDAVSEADEDEAVSRAGNAGTNASTGESGLPGGASVSSTRMAVAAAVVIGVVVAVVLLRRRRR